MTKLCVLASKRGSEILAEQDFAILRDHGYIVSKIKDDHGCYELYIEPGTGTKQLTIDELLDDVKAIGFTKAEIVEK